MKRDMLCCVHAIREFVQVNYMQSVSSVQVKESRICAKN